MNDNIIEAIVYPSDRKGPTVKQKFVRWVKLNKEPIIVGSVFVGFMGLVIWAAVKDAQWMEQEQAEYAKYLSDLSEWIRQENGLGKTVYQLMDGSYISVPVNEAVVAGATAMAAAA